MSFPSLLLSLELCVGTAVAATLEESEGRYDWNGTGNDAVDVGIAVDRTGNEAVTIGTPKVGPPANSWPLPTNPAPLLHGSKTQSPN